MMSGLFERMSILLVALTAILWVVVTPVVAMEQGPGEFCCGGPGCINQCCTGDYAGCAECQSCTCGYFENPNHSYVTCW